MSARETFTFEGADVSVEETADALTYRFVPTNPPPRTSPIGFVLFLVLFPLGLLALVVYAHSKVANRPEWESALVGVLSAQLLVWLVIGTSQCYGVIRWLYHPFGVVLRFTRTHLWHGGNRVCELEQMRGLRLFVYPTADQPPEKAEACLSLVIGEEVPSAKPAGFSGTHGLFGACNESDLRALAEHIHRRLAAFRANQGMMSTLDALSVVETNETDAAKLMHTRPAPDSLAQHGFAGIGFILQNRWAGIAWCLTMFAGLFAAARMVAAAGLSAPFILPFGLLGFVHFPLLVYHLTPQTKPDKRSE